jgi:hypothetical protein
MMPTIPPDLLAAAARIALALAAFAVYALLAARWHRSLRRDNERLFEQVDLALGGMRELADCVTAAQAKLGELAARIEAQDRAPPRAPQTVSTPRGYDVAIRLARSGASAEELASACGIATHEADLLTRLHGVRKTPSAATSSDAPARFARSSSH